jgi:hypothetical protein
VVESGAPAARGGVEDRFREGAEGAEAVGGADGQRRAVDRLDATEEVGGGDRGVAAGGGVAAGEQARAGAGREPAERAVDAQPPVAAAERDDVAGEAA